MLFYLLLFLSAAYTQVKATHYRGGTASWRHISTSGNSYTIEVTYKIGWRRSWSNCDDADIASMTPITGYPDDEWRAIISGPNPLLAEPHMICVAYDISEDWAYGYNAFNATVTTNDDIFEIRYTDCCWIDNLLLGEESNVEWVLQMFDVDLRPRSDTGIVNFPPVTTMPPVITLYFGCPQTFTIPWTDDDGDEVTCRYGSGFQECGDVCGAYTPHFTLYDNCTIYYSGGGQTGLVPVALILEDHPPASITIGNRNLDPEDTISRIPLQFIAKLVSTPNCDVPTFTGVTPSNGDVTCVRNGEILDVTLEAIPSDASGSITQFVVTGPGGLMQTPIQSVPGGSYASQLTWTPPAGQTSDVNICFYARDSFDKVSETRCFTVEFGCQCEPNPCQNGGTCTVSTLTGYLCHCPDTYYGRDCDCR